MTIVQIDEKHTEEAVEKEEKKLNFVDRCDTRELFDGIDADLRLGILLGR
jgi:hypothetical protein